MKTIVSLNQKQLDLLELVAKYRFVTVANVQTYFNLKSRGGVYEKLNVLVKAGYIAVRYDKSFKLQYRPASYYLTPKGLRQVQKHLPYITDAIIRAAYNDKNASDALIQESAELFELSRSLGRTYPNMTILTARQLGDIEYFPRPLPSLYLAYKQGDETTRFFLYHFRDVKRYDVAVRSHITKLIAYRESNTYAESGNEFPAVLFVCDSASIERLAERVMRSALSKSYESIAAYTTSYQALVQQDSSDQSIWSSIDDPEVLISL